MDDDYRLLKTYINGAEFKSAFDRYNAAELESELKKAVLVKRTDFPPDVVRLNSVVKVKADDRNELIEITVVTPDKADIKEKKISVMAPVGTALIGFRKGQQVKWNVPSGQKTFTIVEVTNRPF